MLDLIAASESDLKGLLICLVAAVLVGAVVWGFLAYVAKVAWAGLAAGACFLLVVLFCILDG